MTTGLIQRLMASGLFFCAFGALVAGATVSDAFDDVDTHPRITGVSVGQSSLDATLKSELGLTQGVEIKLRSADGVLRAAVDWLTVGSTLEDSPTCRASNHFHNPLMSFYSSGLSDTASGVIRTFCGPIRSNVTWGTRFASPTTKGEPTGNTFDWDAARAAYLDSLTRGASADREAALADTFAALGHVMHLVQDLAVLAHARNDFESHLQYCFTSFSRWCENDFERFVRRRTALVDNAVSLAVDFGGQGVTRFWDRDQYLGTSPSTDLIQGLAEYTNANFASQYTILTESLDQSDPHWFPYPRVSSTNLDQLVPQNIVARQVESADSIIDTALYVGKIADGEPIEHFAKVSYLWRDVANLPLGPPFRLLLYLDDAVNQDYAKLLLPRAIGYSAGLLDYFFRGKLDVAVVPDPEDNTRSRFLLRGTNASGTDASPEPLVEGTIELYADDANGVRRRVSEVSDFTPISVTPAQPVQRGDPIQSAPFLPPPNAVRYVAVYQGTLGQEPGAVIGKVLPPGVVEELIVAPIADGTLDVWFRNDSVFQPLGIRALLPSDPRGVKWGQDGNSFFTWTGVGQSVETRGYQYQVFAFDRPADTVMPQGQVPRVIPLDTAEPFNTDLVVLDVTAQVGQRGSQQYVTEEFLGFFGDACQNYSYAPTGHSLGLTQRSVARKQYSLRDIFYAPPAGGIFSRAQFTEDTAWAFFDEGGGFSTDLYTVIADRWLDRSRHLVFLIQWNAFDLEFPLTGTRYYTVKCVDNDLVATPVEADIADSIIDDHVFLYDSTAQSVLWRSFQFPASVDLTRDTAFVTPDPADTLFDFRPVEVATQTFSCTHGDPPQTEYKAGVCGKRFLWSSPGSPDEEITLDPATTTEWIFPTIQHPASLAFVAVALAQAGFPGAGIWFQQVADRSRGQQQGFFNGGSAVEMHAVNQDYTDTLFLTNSLHFYEGKILHLDPDAARTRLFVVVEMSETVGAIGGVASPVGVAAFIIDGNGALVQTLVNWDVEFNGGGNPTQLIRRLSHVTLLSGNAHHVLWLGDWWEDQYSFNHILEIWLTDLDTGQSRLVASSPGGGIEELSVHDLALLAPDFLYARAEGDQKFVRGWDPVSRMLTLDPDVSEGSAFTDTALGTLATAPSVIAPPLQLRATLAGASGGVDGHMGFVVVARLAGGRSIPSNPVLVVLRQAGDPVLTWRNPPGTVGVDVWRWSPGAAQDEFSKIASLEPVETYTVTSFFFPGIHQGDPNLPLPQVHVINDPTVLGPLGRYRSE